MQVPSRGYGRGHVRNDSREQTNANHNNMSRNRTPTAVRASNTSDLQTPNLILQGSEEEEETVRMDKWKIEDILEFLGSKLSSK